MSWLDSIYHWIMDKKNQVLQAHPSYRWIFWSVVGLVLIFCLLGLYLYRASIKRRIAQLLFERNVAQEAAKELKDQTQIGVDTEVIKENQDSIDAIQKNITNIDQELQSLQNQQTKVDNQIDNLKSWNDLDNITSKPGSNSH